MKLLYADCVIRRTIKDANNLASRVLLHVALVCPENKKEGVKVCD